MMNDIERAIDTCKQLSRQVDEMIADDLSITAVQALEKQLPMKTEVYVSKNDTKIGRFNFKSGCAIHRCPVCKTNTAYGKYCCECGQRIERSEP